MSLLRQSVIKQHRPFIIDNVLELHTQQCYKYLVEWKMNCVMDKVIAFVWYITWSYPGRQGEFRKFQHMYKCQRCNMQFNEPLDIWAYRHTNLLFSIIYSSTNHNSEKLYLSFFLNTETLYINSTTW